MKPCALPQSGPCLYRGVANSCGNPARCLHAPDSEYRQTFAVECVAANAERLAAMCDRALRTRHPAWLVHRLAELRRECAGIAAEIGRHDLENQKEGGSKC